MKTLGLIFLGSVVSSVLQALIVSNAGVKVEGPWLAMTAYQFCDYSYGAFVGWVISRSMVTPPS